mmetsp:Transcript_37397/g.96687  ORF Transcript_37397/g.96687 Transcript_37397/m.96687 type:complete len:548 (+) Transcript_37397:9344-10987(+)
MPLHALHPVLDADEVLELRLELVQAGLLALEVFVFLADVVLPAPLKLGELHEVLVALVLRRLDATSEQQHHLEDLAVLGDAVVEGTLRARALHRRQVGVEDQLHVLGDRDGVPGLDHLGALEHGHGAAVDGRLDVLDRGHQAHAQAVELQVHLEEGGRQILALAVVRGQPQLHRPQGALRGVQERLVHRPVVVRLHLDDLALRDGRDVRVELEGDHDAQHVVHGVLDLEALGHQEVGGRPHVPLLHVDELVQRDELLLLRQIHQEHVRHQLQVGLNAVLHEVVHGDHEHLQLVQLLPDLLEVGLDVHGSPRQRDHAGPHLELEVLDVGLQQVRDDRLHELGDSPVLLQEVRQLVVVGLELLLLQQHHLGGLGHLDAAHAVHAPRLADQLQDLGVEVDVEAHAVVRVLDEQRRLQPGLHRLDGVDPGLVPEGLELDEGLGHLVVHADELLGILAGQDGGVALELAHGPLDALVQVPRPRDVPGDRRQVPHERRRSLALLVLILDLVELKAVVVEDHRELGLEVGAQVVALQDALELVQQLQRRLDRGD